MKNNNSRTKSGGEESLEQWSSLITPTLGENHDQEEHNYQHHLYRKSVLSKVKDKAMIWRRITKRHSYNDAFTPEWGVSLQDDDEFDDHEDAHDAHFSVPVHDQSKMAPEKIKGAAKQQPKSIPVVYQRHVLDNRSFGKSQNDSKGGGDDQDIPASKTLTRSVTKKLVAPAFAVVSGAQKIASMLQDVVVSRTSVASAAWEGTSSSLQQIMDKGVSVVKENVIEKLDQPEKEEEETANSKKIPNDTTGVRKKVKEAVASILENELALESSSNVVSTNVPTTPIATTNAQLAEENRERILQSN